MITRYVCPIPECGWIHWVPQLKNSVNNNADTLAEISATVARIRDYMDAGKVVTAHFETHTALQWSVELHRANRLVELPKAQLAAVTSMTVEHVADPIPEEITIGLEAMVETIQEAG